jgi:hypothetical protein
MEGDFTQTGDWQLDFGRITRYPEVTKAGPIPLFQRVHANRAPIHSGSCSPIPKDASSVQTTLVWLDRDEYSETDQPKFEVRVLNIGSVPIKIPFSPHLADFQPKDPVAKFSYWEMFVGLRGLEKGTA